MEATYYIEGFLRQPTAPLARDYLGVDFTNLNGGMFKFSTSIIASDPGSGSVRLDAATWAAATKAYVSVISDNKVDATKFLALLNTGDIFVIQDRSNSSVYGRYTISGPAVDNNGWFTIPLTHVKSLGSVPSNNKQIAVVVQYT